MDTKTATEKLRILLPHWIEHNGSHEDEFHKWALAARTEGSEDLAKLLEEAAKHMAATGELLKKAEMDAGGSDGEHHHPHGHHHNHG